MTNYDVITKLVGKINPIGETHIDDPRYENLKEMLALVESLLHDISEVAKNEERYEYSMKRAGELSREHLKAWAEYCR